MTPAPIWSPENTGHLEFFLVEVLAPLATASRVKDFTVRPGMSAGERDEVRRAAMETARIWLVGLEDVPRAALVAAVRSLVKTCRWLPKPSEIRAAAAEAVEAVRAERALEARKLLAACTAGCLEGFIPTTIDGVETMTRCGCRVAADRVLTARPAPLALPAASFEESEARA